MQIAYLSIFCILYPVFLKLHIFVQCLEIFASLCENRTYNVFIPPGIFFKQQLKF